MQTAHWKRIFDEVTPWTKFDLIICLGLGERLSKNISLRLRLMHKVLEKRFGHPSVVAQAFRDMLKQWSRISLKDGNALREFADYLRTCKLGKQSVEDMDH